MTNNSQNNPGDDEVLAQFYKKGAKETPPAKLNSKIINYAANPDTSSETPKSVGSHFGGGWKVPLSMAASVVVVFALLVQLDQSPQQLELPPIPELSIPIKDSAAKNQPTLDEYNEELFEAEEALADDTPSFKNDTSESDMDSQNSGALIIDKSISTESQRSTDSIQAEPNKNSPSAINPSAIKKSIEKEAVITRERFQSEQKPASAPTTQSSSTSSTITKSKSEEGYAPPIHEKLEKPQAVQKQMQAPAKDNLQNNNASGATSGKSSSISSSPVLQEKPMHERRDGSNITGMATDADVAEQLDSDHVETEAEFAPIPVEDWLLMIEKLVAQKDYAEAARQLTKFKQAHPKVNVEDLDAKIP